MGNINSQRVIDSRRRKKKRLVEAFGGKCQKCGYDKFYGALQFHHIDPATKEFSIAHANRSYKLCLEEAKKCALLCGNCHAEIHAMISNKEIVVLRPAKILTACSICGERIRESGRKYCSLDCSSFASRKIARPLKKVLEKEIEESNWLELGRKYGVSDNAVRKWARAYKLIK